MRGSQPGIYNKIQCLNDIVNKQKRTQVNWLLTSYTQKHSNDSIPFCWDAWETLVLWCICHFR